MFFPWYRQVRFRSPEASHMEVLFPVTHDLYGIWEELLVHNSSDPHNSHFIILSAVGTHLVALRAAPGPTGPAEPPSGLCLVVRVPPSDLL